jgi:hypothetical protein
MTYLALLGAFILGMATAYATVRKLDRRRERHRLSEYFAGYRDGRMDEAWEHRWSVGVPSPWTRN